MNDMQVSAVDASANCDGTAEGPDEVEISLADVLVAIGERKHFVLRFMLIAAVLGAMLSFLMSPVYEAKTVILPPQQGKSGIIASLEGLSSMAGLGDALSVKTPEEMYVGLLQSDGVANDLITRFKLSERYGTTLSSKTRLILAKKTKIASEKKTGFITIAVSDKSPQFAAKLANAYVDELGTLLSRLAVTDAQQRRVFFEREIKKTLTKMSEAQLAFDENQKKSGVVSLDAQVASSIQTSATLKARIEALEVQLQSMRTYATENNPEIKRVLAEIQAMQSQLNVIEQGDADADSSENSNVSVALANIRAYREVKYQEALLDEFRKQLELAKVDEAREGPLVQQIDVAVPPDHRVSPRRALITIIAAVGGLWIGLLAVLLRAAYDSRGPFAHEFRRVCSAWRFRKSAV
jgi:uncharacterized protein involved in exopolysaccharide biosynthesis